MYILEGLLLGFASVLLIGPVVFVLINASAKSGLKSGISVAIGIIIGDIIYAIACFKGLNYIIDNMYFNKIVGVLGFVILFIMGLIYTFKKEVSIDFSSIKTKKSEFKYFLEGFSINFFNPFVLSVWLTVANYAKNSYSDNSIAFLISALAGIFIIDIVKVFLSKKLLLKLSSKKLSYFYKFSGIIMILFSFRILYFLVLVF